MPAFPSQMPSAAEVGAVRWPSWAAGMAAGIGSICAALRELVPHRAAWHPISIVQGMLEVDKGAVLTASGACLGLIVCSSVYFNVVKGDLQLQY